MVLVSGTPNRKPASADPLLAPVKVKLPRAVGLRELVVLLPAEVAAVRHRVPPVLPRCRGGDLVRAVAIKRTLHIGKAVDAAGETQVRRSPVGRALFVAHDASVARDVHDVLEVGTNLRGAVG